MNTVVDMDRFRFVRKATAKHTLEKLHEMLEALTPEERRLFGDSLCTVVAVPMDRAAHQRELTYKALLDDTCDFMRGLIDPARVPNAQDRDALSCQIEAIREYGGALDS